MIASTRWAFEAMVNLTDMGKKLVDDPCWDERPKNDQDGETGWKTILDLSDSEKRAQGCICMGSAIFESCNDFPGILSADVYDESAQSALARLEPAQPLTPTPILRQRPTLHRRPTQR